MDESATFTKYCDYCDCPSCSGATRPPKWERRAMCEDGTWICSTCYLYDMCTSTTRDHEKTIVKSYNLDGPCDDLECEHRPRLRIPPLWIS